MITLLLDSSNKDLAVGLGKDDVLIDSIIYEAWQSQSEHMIVEIDNLLSKHNLIKDDLSNVMVGIGPGSYTGVRIALTIAKVIGVALNIPVYTVSSLQILKDDDRPSICLIDARSNRSYIGVYQNNIVILEDRVMNNDEVINYINSHKEYSICGECKYLKLESKKVNVLSMMLSLRKNISPVNDVLAIKPVYLKDNYSYGNS